MDSSLYTLLAIAGVLVAMAILAPKATRIAHSEPDTSNRKLDRVNPVWRLGGGQGGVTDSLGINKPFHPMAGLNMSTPAARFDPTRMERHFLPYGHLAKGVDMSAAAGERAPHIEQNTLVLGNGMSVDRRQRSGIKEETVNTLMAEHQRDNGVRAGLRSYTQFPTGRASAGLSMTKRDDRGIGPRAPVPDLDTSSGAHRGGVQGGVDTVGVIDWEETLARHPPRPSTMPYQRQPLFADPGLR